ncbi:hypothetical protein ACIRO1_33065 [Streptomyces sp. NPDC102381]|uniref:hypothetical protein n=1 Tax=Streptomyces sp. NPDC102381 TaxID=3366164 RepID=UPI00381EA2C0
MAQVTEREALVEHDLIGTDDEYELDFRQVPDPSTAHRKPPVHRTPASRRRSRGR